MSGSKQMHIFKRNSNQFMAGRKHGSKKMKYEIEFGIDDLK